MNSLIKLHNNNNNNDDNNNNQIEFNTEERSSVF